MKRLGKQPRAARLIEQLETRAMLSASTGNCPPEFDLNSAATQEVRVGQSLNFNIFTEGAVYTDEDGADTPRNLMLDPDPEDTPDGARITRTGQFNWTPTLGQIGTHRIVVIAIDDGTPAKVSVEFMTVDVRSGNDAPSFDIVADPPSVEEDAGAQLVFDFATNISAGALDEAGQDLQFMMTSNSNPSLFSVLPGITVDGTLNYTPAPNRSGTAEITVVLMDDGGTANGGIDTSDPMTFTIQVDSVNDAPVISLPAMVTVDEDTSATIDGLSVTDVELELEGGEAQASLTAGNGTISLSATEGLTFLVGTGANDTDMVFTGTLADINTALDGITYQPTGDFNGGDALEVEVSDQGVAGGDPQVTTETLMIDVRAVNDAPTIVLPSDQFATAGTALLIPGVSIGDADVAEGSGTLQLTVRVENGTITLGGVLSGNQVNTSGSPSSLNNFLSSLEYVANPSFEGTDILTVTVNDQGNTGTPGPLETSQLLNIEVIVDNNIAPDLQPIPDVDATVGSLLEIPLLATDDDGNTISFQFSDPVPDGVELDDQGDGTAFVRWTPTIEDFGTYLFGVAIVDDGTPPKSDFEFFDVTVGGPLLVDTLIDEDDGDFGPGDLSLREAIGVANSTTGTQEIEFHTDLAGGTIDLSMGALVISDALVVNAAGLSQPLSIDAGLNSRVVEIAAGNHAVTFSGMHLVNGQSSTQGGAIYSETMGTVRVSDGEVSGSNAMDGGAIFSSGRLEIVNMLVTGNTATGDGGGIMSEGDSIVIRSMLGGNAAANGGAIAQVAGQVAVESSTISLNISQGPDATGGGIYAPGRIVAVANSTVSSNAGGGIVAANATVRSSTITANNGVGVVVTDSVTVANSIVARNTADAIGPDLDTSGSATVAATYSLIGDNAGTSLVESQMPDADGNLIGSAAGSGIVDPMLDGLADNGGPTLTHALLDDSPAIDAGDPAFANEFANDQRGDPYVRIADGDLMDAARVDMGAFETQVLSPSTFIVDTLEDSSDGDFSPGDRSLREVIDVAVDTGLTQAITFAESLGGGTIALHGPIVLLAGVTLDATGVVGGLTIDAQQGSRVFHVSTADDVAFRGLSLTGGRTTGDGMEQGGAAILSQTPGLLTLEQVTIDGNVTAGSEAHGAGVAAVGPIEIVDSTISNNRAEGAASEGGGIWSAEAVTITNSTISGNQSDGDGGGIRAMRDLVLRNATVVDNRTTGDSTTGGGLRGGSNNDPTMAMLMLSSSIVANNTLRAFDNEFPSDALWPNGLIMADFSLLGNRAGTNLAEAQSADANGNLVGSVTGAGVIDPMLADLADNGGPTWTHLPLVGSPVIDAGRANGLTADQRGQSRTVDDVAVNNGDDGTDMGAVERDLTTIVVSSEREIARKVLPLELDSEEESGETAIRDFIFGELGRA